MPADNAAAPAVGEATAQNNGSPNVVNQPPANQNADGAAQPAAGQQDPGAEAGEQSLTESFMDRLGIEGEARDVVRRNAEVGTRKSEEAEDSRGQKDDTKVVPPEGDDHEQEHEHDGEPEAAAKEQWPKEAIALKDKYRRQRNEARDAVEERDEKIAALEAQLEEGPQVAPIQPTVADPLANISDLNTLAQTQQALKIIRQQCRLNPDGWVANEGTANEKVVTADDVRRALVEAEDALEMVPLKEKALFAKPQFDARAKEILPGMFDRGTEDYQAAQVALRDNQWLANDPQKNLKLAVFLRGWKAIAAEQGENGSNHGRDRARPSKNGNGASLKDVIPPELVEQHRNRGKVPILKQSPPGRPGGSASPNGGEAVDQAMQNVLKEGGSTESISAAIAARMALRQETNPDRAVLV